jgi:Flp pilus assembly pilin Flp
MTETWRRLGRDESGQDLTEYALLLALLALVVIVAVAIMGTRISDVLGTTGTTLESGIQGG